MFKLSKNPQNLKDNFLNKTSLSDIIKISFNKFKNYNNNIKLDLKKAKDEPIIKFRDEIMYGIGNIIQNAIQHADKIVGVELIWTNSIINIIISDDGPGFTKEKLDNIGSPFITSTKKYGMGLGIFITKYLIERIEGKIIFTNNKNSVGSCVKIQLNRKKLEI